MSIGRTLLTLVVGTILCTVVAGVVFAHRPAEPQEDGQLEELVRQANLVVVGEVAEVEYVTAEIEGEGELPHTFVTYELRDTLRGKPTGETLTLRFLGGADGRGGYLTISGIPQFQEGEQDLLFVTGNGEDGRCPLVECEHGRFRLYQNRVFNTHGQPVRGIIDDNPIARGPRAEPFRTFHYPTPEFDDLMKNPQARAVLEELGKSVEEAREEYRSQAPRSIAVVLGGPPPSRVADHAARDPQARGRESGGRPEVVLGERPVAVEEFVAKVRELNRRTGREPEPVQSVERRAPIVLPDVRPTTPGSPEEMPRPEYRSARDREEFQALERQDFNPVLKEKND